jgi:hypothetical protein
MDAGRQLKKWLSPEQLLLTCRVMAPFYKVTAAMLHRLGVMEFRKRTVREITLDLFDAFAPQYNHRHTEDEVQQWFKEEGLSNIRVSGKQKHGFGVYGDRLNRKLSSHNSESASRSSSEDVQNPAAAFSD